MERLFDQQFYLDQLAAARAWLGANAVALSVATVAQREPMAVRVRGRDGTAGTNESAKP